MSSITEVPCTSEAVGNVSRFHSRTLQPLGIDFELCIAYPYRSHWQPDLMARDELIELGARSLFGGRRALADRMPLRACGYTQSSTSLDSCEREVIVTRIFL